MDRRPNPTHGDTHEASQRGGFVIGLIVGLLIGLALALGVALYVTKVPVPFVNKVPQRTAEQDAAETERNKNWDPNAPLAGKPRPAARRRGAASAPAPPCRPPRRRRRPRRGRRAKAARAGQRARPGGHPRRPRAAARRVKPTPAADPFIYFVQAGAFARPEDAEQQRARLAMMGFEAKVTEREQSGRTVYRVRIGPFDAQGRCRRREGQAGRRRRRGGAGARAEVSRSHGVD